MAESIIGTMVGLGEEQETITYLLRGLSSRSKVQRGLGCRVHRPMQPQASAVDDHMRRKRARSPRRTTTQASAVGSKDDHMRRKRARSPRRTTT